MSILIDTNVAVHLRDGEPAVTRRITSSAEPVVMSVVTRVELAGGLAGPPDRVSARLPRLRAILQAIPVLPFRDEEADEFERIVAATVFSRRKILDRMIAAQAIVHGADLLTLNPADFVDVPGLRMAKW